ncbi:MAG TPA: Ldh family oxidoreductase [Bryobacterales bacterium]|nr:Ldh family oxidoreductase [Bryobacterales bacterium]
MGNFRLCPPQPLEQYAAAVFRALGADQEVAAEVARHLVRSNLSGHDSHGVIRITQYADQIKSGEIRPAARPVILREAGATALIDAQRGFGHYSTVFALEWAMARAAESGVAAAAVRHSTHIGRLGEYTERAAAHGLIAIVTVGACGPGVGGMVLFGGRKKFLGANPWSIGIPTGGALPMMYDGSTSAVAEGKVRVARAKKVPLPSDCIVGPDLQPATDPEAFYAGGALAPLGGRVAGHKGSGLALASALLGSLGTIDDPDPTLIGASVRETSADPRGRAAGVFLAAVDPAFFGDAAHYRAMVEETLAAAKRVPAAEGVAEVLVPGEPEIRSREQRSRDGIPIPEATWQDLAGVAQRFGLEMPEAKIAQL